MFFKSKRLKQELYSDVILERIHDVDLIYRDEEQISGCKCCLRINVGNDYENNKVNFEGIDYSIETNDKMIRFGHLSNKDEGEPWAYLDVQGKDYEVKNRVFSKYEDKYFYYSNIEYQLSSKSFLKACKEVVLIIREFNKDFFFGGKKTDKQTLLNIISIMADLKLEKEYNNLLRIISDIYNSYITEQSPKDKEQRAIQILANVDYKEKVRREIETFKSEYKFDLVKGRNDFSQIVIADRRLDYILKKMEFYIRVREDYSKLKDTSRWQKKDNIKAIDEIKKDFYVAAKYREELRTYYHKIISGMMEGNDVEICSDVYEKFIEKFDDALGYLITLSGGLSFADPIGIETARTRYECKRGKAKSVLNILAAKYSIYSNLHSNAMSLREEWQMLVRESRDYNF